MKFVFVWAPHSGHKWNIVLEQLRVLDVLASYAYKPDVKIVLEKVRRSR